MATPTPTPTLPSGHAVEIVRPGSRFLGQIDCVTRRPIEPDDMIVVCHHVPHPAVVTVRTWLEMPSCTNCAAANPGFGLPPMPPPGQGYKGPAIPTLVAPAGSLPGARREPERRRSSSMPLLILVGLLLLAAAGALVVALGGGDETSPPPTGQTTANEGIVVVPTDPPPTRAPAPTSAPRPTATLRPTTPPTRAPAPTTEPNRAGPTPRPAAPIDAIVLYDAGSDRALLALSDGGTIDLSQLGTSFLNIVAETNTPVGSVQFLLDGDDFCKNGRCLENTAPYSMAGDDNGNYYNNWDWSGLLGSHTIQIIPYSGANAGGERLPDVTLRFTVVP